MNKLICGRFPSFVDALLRALLLCYSISRKLGVSYISNVKIAMEDGVLIPWGHPGTI